MRKTLVVSVLTAAVVAVLSLATGCGPEKATIPSTFAPKPDKPPVGAGAPPIKGGAPGKGNGGATDS